MNEIDWELSFYFMKQFTTFADKAINFFSNIEDPIPGHSEIKSMSIFQNDSVRENIRLFYQKYYSDADKRTFVIGINPGRLGSGVTGIPFTDTHTLHTLLDISQKSTISKEPTSQFVSQLIKQYPNPADFYKKYFLTSLSPVGFTKNNKNFNFYDDMDFYRKIKPYLIESLRRQLSLGALPKAIVWGKGKNYSLIKQINDEYNFFTEITPLEHPRYVIQYKRSELEDYILHQKSVFEMSRV
jgi:hypothetical protein